MAAVLAGMSETRDGVWKQREGVHPDHSRDMEQLPGALAGSESLPHE